MKYKVCVVEKHEDTVIVEANSMDEAVEKAIAAADCQYSCIYDAVVVERGECLED